MQAGDRVRYIGKSLMNGKEPNPYEDLVTGMEGVVVDIRPFFTSFPLLVAFDAHIRPEEERTDWNVLEWNMRETELEKVERV